MCVSSCLSPSSPPSFDGDKLITQKEPSLLCYSSEKRRSAVRAPWLSFFQIAKIVKIELTRELIDCMPTEFCVNCVRLIEIGLTHKCL